MGLDARVFAGFVLRTFLGELGSKTFFLSTILAAWCPWEGARSHDDRSVQLLLVFLGTYVADVIRMCMIAFVNNKTWLFSASDGLCCFLFLVLALRARWELSSVDAREQRRLNASSHSADAAGGATSAGGDVEKAKDSSWSGEWNTSAFSVFALQPAEPKEVPKTQYGTADQYVAVDGALSSRPSDRAVSTVLSFVFPLLLVFLAQADDKVTSLMIDSGVEGAQQVSGTLTGFLLATAMAVILGMFCERQLSDHRLLFMVSLTLFALSIISLSQALLYLNAASPLPQTAKDAATALLSMLGVDSLVSDVL